MCNTTDVVFSILAQKWRSKAEGEQTIHKKLFMIKRILLAVVLTGFMISIANAQSSYKTGIGLGIDFGTGQTLVGPSVKHFFTQNHVGQFEALFGNHYTILDAFYEYHKSIPNAAGLRWFLGIGIGAGLYKGGSDFLLRPIGGLDYKINDVPLSFSFDWRPTVFIGDGDSDFEPARFGLGFRYAF